MATSRGGLDLFGGITNFFTGDDQNEDYKELQGLQSDIVGATRKGINPFLTNYGFSPAPFTDWQTQAGQGAANLVGGMSPNYSGAAYGMLGAGNQPGQNFTGQFLGMLGRGNEALGSASQYATTDIAEIEALADPYADAMTDVAMRRLDDSRSRSASDIGARAAAGGAFGGSREAVQRSLLNEDFMEQSADTAAQIQSDAYRVGAGLAQQNTANENQMLDRLTNARFQAAGMDMNALSQAQGAEGDYLTRLLAGRNFDLSALGAAENLAGGYGARQMGALGLLGSFGDQRQQYEQAMRDKDYTTASRLLGMLSGNAPEEEASGLQQLIGMLATGAGIFGNVAAGVKDLA